MSEEDKIVSKANSDAYTDNWERLFGFQLPVGQKTVKDRVDLGLSPSTVVEDYVEEIEGQTVRSSSITEDEDHSGIAWGTWNED